VTPSRGGTAGRGAYKNRRADEIRSGDYSRSAPPRGCGRARERGSKRPGGMAGVRLQF